jgi:anti-sigma regulatory factor (Ser/Thr protein kinase)
MERLTVTDPSHVAAARRFAAQHAATAGYDETDAGRLAIIVTELANNVLHHGGGGEMLVGLDTVGGTGLQVIALDRGPGMANVAECLRDGFSTGGTPGNGLGAVQRLAQDVAIHSRPGAGTAVLARIRRRGDPVPSGRPRYAAVSVAKPGETVCGDAASIVVGADGKVALLVADGLGHGPIASEASQEATRLFRKLAPGSPAQALQVLHAGLRHTRGAAIAAALIDPRTSSALYGGIGNIAGFILDGNGTRRLVSHAGTAGHTAHRFQEFGYALGAAPVLVMFSDGLTSSWSPEVHTGLFHQDPALVAAVLYRDHARNRDDATVLVWRG